MQQTVFKEFLQQALIKNIEVIEKLPSKGKPAQKEPGTATVWIIRFLIGDRESFLESARGGLREWASLDNLNKWLRSNGIFEYDVKLLLQPDITQQSFEFQKDSKIFS